MLGYLLGMIQIIRVLAHMQRFVQIGQYDALQQWTCLRLRWSTSAGSQMRWRMMMKVMYDLVRRCRLSIYGNARGLLLGHVYLNMHILVAEARNERGEQHQSWHQQQVRQHHWAWISVVYLSRIFLRVTRVVTLWPRALPKWFKPKSFFCQNLYTTSKRWRLRSSNGKTE